MSLCFTDTSNGETLVENGGCEVNSEIKCLEENEQTRRPKGNTSDSIISFTLNAH